LFYGEDKWRDDFTPRVEDGRGGFRFSVAMAILSNCRLNATYHAPLSCPPYIVAIVPALKV